MNSGNELSLGEESGNNTDQGIQPPAPILRKITEEDEAKMKDDTNQLQSSESNGSDNSNLDATSDQLASNSPFKQELGLKLIAKSPQLLPGGETEEQKKRRRIRKNILRQLGEILAGIIAFGCGLMVAANFIALGLLTPGALAYSIAGVLFCAVTYVNWLINKNSAPEVLVEMFGRKVLFKMLTMDSKGKPLSLEKKIWLGIGFFASLAAGCAQAVLTFNGAFILSKGLVFLGLGSGFIPPIAIALAVVALTCVTAMILKNIAALVRNPKVFDDCKAYLKNLFDFTPRQTLRAKITVISAATFNQKAFDSTLSSDVDIHYYFRRAETAKEKDVLYFARKDQQGNIIRQLIELNRPENMSEKLTELYKKLRKAPFYDHKYTDPRSTITLCIPSQLPNDEKSLTEQQSLLKEIMESNNHPTILPKSQTRINWEKGLTIFFMAIALPLAGLGLFMTMRASAAGLQTFMFKYIPQFSVTVVDFVAKSLMLPLAVLGRIVFTGRNTLRTITNLFIDQSKTQMTERPFSDQHDNVEKEPLKSSQRLPSSILSKGLSRVGAYVLSVFNAIGNGLISLMGALTMGLGKAFGWLAGAAGTWVSFSAGVSAGLLDGASPEKKMLMLNSPADPKPSSPNKPSSSEGLQESKKPPLSLLLSPSSINPQGGGLETPISSPRMLFSPTVSTPGNKFVSTTI